MSKLAHVREALQTNSAIVIVEVVEQNNVLDSWRTWGLTVDFYLAPKCGCIHEVSELQTLMMSLVPAIEPTSKEDFRETEHEIAFGRLCFEEDIGTEIARRRIVLTDREAVLACGFKDAKHVDEHTKTIRRLTHVRLYPNVEIAKDALRNKNVCYITKGELKKHYGITGYFARLFS